ncbi:MAG: glycosyltransferase family 2 protein [Hyphomicrobiaceae bacterium]
MHNLNSPKVSVLIPTRERPDTLVKSLKTVVNQSYSNLEIIVSDNASSPETEAVVRSFECPRIRYFNTGKRISMSHNFEFALSKATGDWIAAIGDDDGLLPGGIARAVELLQASGVEAMGSLQSYYVWPNKDWVDGSILSVPMAKGVSFKNAKEAIRLSVTGHLGYVELPMLYTGGMISSKVIAKVKAANDGAFFNSQIPDCYSAFAVCSVIDRYVFTQEPFAIAGSSKHSNGGNLLRLKGTAFLTEGNIPFHPDIPLPEIGTLTFSIPALVYESYLQTQFLHGDFAHIKPADQLELILNATPIGRDILLEWAKTFAAKHNFDCEPIVAKAARAPLNRRLALGLQTFENVRDRYRIDSSLGLEINDVYEASIVAATIMKTRPSKLTSYRRLLSRRFTKRAQPSLTSHQPT